MRTSAYIWRKMPSRLASKETAELFYKFYVFKNSARFLEMRFDSISFYKFTSRFLSTSRRIEKPKTDLNYVRISFKIETGEDTGLPTFAFCKLKFRQSDPEYRTRRRKMLRTVSWHGIVSTLSISGQNVPVLRERDFPQYTSFFPYHTCSSIQSQDNKFKNQFGSETICKQLTTF